MAVASAGTLFDEVIDFLASAPTVEQIIAFQPSDTLKQRSHELLERNRNDLLTAEERTELDDLLRMNHFVNMLKIRARQRLTQS
ncbi:MAG: hypothetical protein IT324_09905 [Anaerolineae bacterium]|nr:hypothetical protein [Anaerolineae bacterium]